MTEQYVDRLQTAVTATDLYNSLRDAWSSLIQDANCTRSSLLVLLAHSALETGFWHACYCWNLGNFKYVHGDGHDYFQMRCSEVFNGHTVWISPPDPGCSFVAFDSLEDGARDYLTSLRGRFRTAWPAVVAGDPAQFCHLLKLARYYTADEAIYTAGVMRCYHQLDATIPPDDRNIEPGDPAA